MSTDGEQHILPTRSPVAPWGRAPGQHARSVVLRLRMRTLLTLGALATVTTLAGRAFGLRSPLFMGSEVALLLVILLVYRYVLPLLDRHDRGATGEEHVGGLLEGLPSEWHVLHDISLQRGNVDHVVIGPAGAFSVETKSHPGPIRVDRLHGGLLRQAQAQQALLEQVLQVPVEPLLVYSRAWVDRPLARRKGVRVLPARMLLSHLQRRAAQLSPAEVEALHARMIEALRQDACPDGRSPECGGRPRLPRVPPLPGAEPRVPEAGSRAPGGGLRMPAGARGSVSGCARDRGSHP